MWSDFTAKQGKQACYAVSQIGTGCILVDEMRIFTFCRSPARKNKKSRLESSLLEMNRFIFLSISVPNVMTFMTERNFTRNLVRAHQTLFKDRNTIVQVHFRFFFSQTARRRA